MNDACLDVCGAEERVPMEGSRHIKVFFFRLEPFPLKEIPGFLFGKLDIGKAGKDRFQTRHEGSFRILLDFLHRLCVFNRKGTDDGTDKGGHRKKTSCLFTDISSKRPDVRAGRAGHMQLDDGRRDFPDGQVINRDGARFELDFLSFAGKLVGPFPIHLDC